MLRFLGLLVVLALLVAGFGYYQGWWTVETKDGKEGYDIKVNVDKGQFKKDVDKAKKDVQKTID